MKRLITKIFNLAKKKGLKNLSIVITKTKLDEHDFKFALYVGKKDRFYACSLETLLHCLSDEEKELSWMNS